MKKLIEKYKWRIVKHWKLGIIIDKECKIVNHRSLLKVLLNPFLRCICLQIATEMDPLNRVLGKVTMTKCPFTFLEFSFNYNILSNTILYHRCWI